ncbi:hypothetical protein MJO48_07245 [Dickeya fangzhongdai]|uniref:hypothetical protein n=1 Tax=Dickeya fangzhongdai TaxID=1778540 RepID=UPI001EFA884C|nr:hypothetical protein [Dickeya fangzhongdai]ULR32470.1 hypothetical protein MJO48_07245 [Dickeya fangzhongdai]
MSTCIGNSIAILVVLYNKELSESKTLFSLLNDFYYKGDVTLFIVNNGPNKILFDDSISNGLNKKFHQVIYVEYICNKPLSKIYNEFINNNYDYYVIFDDDSQPDDSYFEVFNDINYDLVLPRIKSSDDCTFYYPVNNGLVVDSECELCIDTVMSISSGIIIGRRIVSIVRNKFGLVFDERYALYGIDTSFLFRLRAIDSNIKNKLSFVCVGIIRHSLSRVVKDSSEFRAIERLYDVAITTRWYSNFYGYGVFLRKFLGSLVRFKFRYSFILFFYYFRGRHPRC